MVKLTNQQVNKVLKNEILEDIRRIENRIFDLAVEAGVSMGCSGQNGGPINIQYISDEIEILKTTFDRFSERYKTQKRITIEPQSGYTGYQG